MVRRVFAVALVAALSVIVVSTPANAAGTVQVTVTGAGGVPVGLSGAFACPAPATPVVSPWASGSPTPLLCSDDSIGVFALLSSTGGGSFGLAPGTWNVDVVVQNGPLTHHSVTVTDGDTTPVLVELAELTGSVLQDDGLPLGVSPQYVYACPGGVPGPACALPEGGARALVNFDGSYRLYLAAGAFDVAPVIGTPVAAPASLAGVGAGDTVTRSFTVTPADIATVTGTVTTSEPVSSTVSACLAPASAPCSDAFTANIAPGATYTLKLGPGTWNLVASASYPTGIASSAPVEVELGGGDVVTQDLAVPAPAIGTLAGTVRRADGSVPPNGIGLNGAYVITCPSALPIAVGISCPGVRTLAAIGGAYSTALPAGSYSVAAVEVTGSIPPPIPSQGVVTIATGGILLCDLVLDGSPAACTAANVDVTPTEGDPGTTFDVSFPCTGLATVSLVDPGPPVTVLASGAQSATGAAHLTLAVPAAAPGTELSVRARCSTTYGGYGGAGSVSFTPVAFTVTGTPDDGDDVEEPPGYDGNGDDVPDAEQPDVTTVETATGAGLVTIVAPDDTHALRAVTATEVPSTPTPPEGVSLPAGLIGFVVDLPDGVTTADVEVRFPAGSHPESYWKLHDSAWLDFSDHATIAGDTVTLHLVDGGPGDDDGMVDGRITDPGTFGFVNDKPRARVDGALVREDTPLVVDVLANDDAGPGEAFQAVHVASLDGAFRGTAEVITSGPDAGKVSFTPGADMAGIAGFQYTVCDDGTPERCDTSAVALAVLAVNDAPTISETDDVAIPRNMSASVAIHVGDVDGPLALLKVTGASANDALVRDEKIEVSGHGATRTVKITPRPGRTGTAIITLTVRDAFGAKSTETFVLTVS